jgi:hypothetical protein
MRPYLIALVVFGCAAPPAAQDDDYQVVDEGKEDDYFSTTAKEFWVEGDTTVTLEADLANASDSAKSARAHELANLKNVVVGYFLNVYLEDKEDTDPNHAALPGFHAMVRDGGWTETSLTATSAVDYRYHFKLQVAGQKNLMRALPGTTAADGSKTIDLTMGKISNTDMARLDAESEWFRDSQWDASNFDPAKVPADQLETSTLKIYPQHGSTDAYLDYGRLYADGELTVAVHFGWDYWDRYDIKNSRKFYDWLTGKGFTSPAADYAHYDAGRDGPLAKTITANGKPVRVKVWVFHPGQPDVAPGPDPDTDAGGDQLNADMYESLRSREVVVFDGHSGDYYGFALADWRKTSHGAIDYPQLATAEMPRDYQIVMANGCQTYSIGEAFWANPAKADKQSLNIVTTTTFSDASSPSELESLIEAVFTPVKAWSDVLTDQNRSSGIGAMYGVHGLDANPKLHPFADLTKLGNSCTSNAACGEGSRCVRRSTGAKVCAPLCLDTTGCPSGYTCRSVASTTTGTITAKACTR